MFTLLGDESNRTPIDGEFFIYGALVVKTMKLGPLVLGIEEIRDKFELSPGTQLKFSPVYKPKSWAIERYHEIRTEVLDLVLQCGGEMMVYVVLHELAKSNSPAATQRMGINSVLKRFEQSLAEKSTWGLAMVDQDNHVFQNIREIHKSGLKLETSTLYLSPRVASVLAFDSQGTHLATAVDIAVGAFRFCVNCLPKGEGKLSQADRTAASHWMSKLKPLLSLDRNGRLNFSSPNVMLRPVSILAPIYRNRYDSLKSHLLDFC